MRRFPFERSTRSSYRICRTLICLLRISLINKSAIASTVLYWPKILEMSCLDIFLVDLWLIQSLIARATKSLSVISTFLHLRFIYSIFAVCELSNQSQPEKTYPPVLFFQPLCAFRAGTAIRLQRLFKERAWRRNDFVSCPCW